MSRFKNGNQTKRRSGTCRKKRRRVNPHRMPAEQSHIKRLKPLSAKAHWKMCPEKKRNIRSIIKDWAQGIAGTIRGRWDAMKSRFSEELKNDLEMTGFLILLLIAAVVFAGVTEYVHLYQFTVVRLALSAFGIIVCPASVVALVWLIQTDAPDSSEKLSMADMVIIVFDIGEWLLAPAAAVCLRSTTWEFDALRVALFYGVLVVWGLWWVVLITLAIRRILIDVLRRGVACHA